MAPAGLMEQASPAIARTLAAIPDHQASSAAVVIPAIASIPPDRLHRLFGMAVEFAESNQLRIDDSDALDLWTVAAVVQVLYLPDIDPHFAFTGSAGCPPYLCLHRQADCFI